MGGVPRRGTYAPVSRHRLYLSRSATPSSICGSTATMRSASRTTSRRRRASSRRSAETNARASCCWGRARGRRVRSRRQEPAAPDGEALRPPASVTASDPQPPTRRWVALHPAGSRQRSGLRRAPWWCGPTLPTRRSRKSAHLGAPRGLVRGPGACPSPCRPSRSGSSSPSVM